MKKPYTLQRGDAIAIVSPSTEVKPEYIDGAMAEMERRGYRPVLMPHAKGPASGSFAALDSERADDLLAALEDPDIKVVFCARGGYGANHLIDRLPLSLFNESGKWIVGFSDISVIHALCQKEGLQSLHSSMAKELAEHPDSEVTESIFRIMEGAEAPAMEWATAPGSITGTCEGLLTGGNLAVLNGLAATPWDILAPDWVEGKILLLEDVGEKIYQVERMLTRLHHAGTLHRAAGLVFGQFTDYLADRNFETMEDMISWRLGEWEVECPVALGAPVGHVAFNIPVVLGAPYRLQVGSRETHLFPTEEKT